MTRALRCKHPVIIIIIINNNDNYLFESGGEQLFDGAIKPPQERPKREVNSVRGVVHQQDVIHQVLFQLAVGKIISGHEFVVD